MNPTGERDRTDRIDELRSRLEAEADIEFALLFGSRANGRPRESSDWDVAVFLDAELGKTERFRRRRQLLGGLNGFEEAASVDLVILNDAPPLLAHRALQGQRLFVREPVSYVRFFVRTMALANDERHWREIHRRARRERLQEGSFGRP